MKAFDFTHDWPGGDVFENPHLRLVLCADWAPARRYARAILDQPGSVYSPEVLEVIQKADFRVVNVETVLHANPVSAHPVPKEGPNLIGAAAAAEDLVEAGFDVGLLANNHTYDFGLEGLVSTRSILEQAGLKTCGTGTSQEDAYAGLVLEAKGVSVALVNFQEGEEGMWTDRAPPVAGWDLDRVCRSIREHVAKGRVVIALPHADREFLPVPSPYTQEAYRRLVEAGASLVVGHHPHVPRGVEIHHEVPILYSQGNFIFAHDHSGLFRKLGYMVEVAVAPEGEIGFRIVPYRLDDRGIHLLDTTQSEWFVEQLAGVSGVNLAPERVLDWWNAAIDAISLESWYASCTGMDYGMELMRKRDPIGLARLRTRLSGPAHYAFMIAGINRILAGDHGLSSPEMIETVRLWTETPADSVPLFR